MLKNLPISRKLTIITMAAAGAALVVACAAALLFEWQSHRRALHRQLLSISEIVAENSTASLLFADTADATGVLQSLRRDGNVVAAALFRADGTLLGTYQGADSQPIPARPHGPGIKAEGEKLTIVQEVRHGGATIGFLYLEGRLYNLYQRFLYYAGGASLVLLFTLLLAVALARLLQRSIARPLEELVGATERASRHGATGVRARKFGNDELGRLTDAFNGMMTEIQERSSALEESEERLRLALQAAGMGTWRYEVETGMDIRDAGLNRLLGLEPVMTRTPIVDFVQRVHPEDRARVDQQIAEAVKTGQIYEVDCRILRPNGDVIWLRDRGRVFKDPHGHTYMTGAAIDITARVQMEHALRESEQRFRTMADAAPVMIWLANPESERTYVNRSWLAFTGNQADHELGQGWLHGMEPDDRPAFRRAYEEAYRDRRAFRSEYRLRRADGQYRWMWDEGSPLFAGERFHGFIGTCVDITAVKEAEEQLRRVNAELEERVERRTLELAKANEELEAFTYSVSHDLRGPLRRIEGFTMLLREAVTENNHTDVEDFLDRIANSARQMNRLIDDLLKLSQVGRKRIALEPVLLDNVVREARESLLTTPNLSEVEWKVARLGEALGDATLLQQAFVNLISNALKYSRDRERPVVEIGRTEIEGEVVFYVRDNGIGFDMQHASRLFGVFERLHDAGQFEGTGVGLAVVQRIILRHGGKVWAQGEPGKGATFFFTLRMTPTALDRN